MRRRATAWLVFVSLVGLLAGQPLHAARLHETPSGVAAATSATWVWSERSVRGAAHDPDLCPLCTAAAQTRLGVLASVHAGVETLAAPYLSLDFGPPLLAASAPGLEHARPRAPPSPLSLRGT